MLFGVGALALYGVVWGYPCVPVVLEWWCFGGVLYPGCPGCDCGVVSWLCSCGVLVIFGGVLVVWLFWPEFQGKFESVLVGQCPLDLPKFGC